MLRGKVAEEVSKEAVGNCLRHEKAGRKSVTKTRLTLAMMDLGGGHRRATGPLLQTMGLRKMPHVSYVVGVACWEVLTLGHGADGCELH